VARIIDNCPDPGRHRAQFREAHWLADLTGGKHGILNPAKGIGMDGSKGALEIGRDADIVITDGDFNVRATYVRDAQVFAGAGASTGR